MTKLEEFAIWVIKEAAAAESSICSIEVLEKAVELDLIHAESSYTFLGELCDYESDEI